jgi:hypothetical protein
MSHFADVSGNRLKLIWIKRDVRVGHQRSGAHHAKRARRVLSSLVADWGEPSTVFRGSQRVAAHTAQAGQEIGRDRRQLFV